jgi:hypothetical protein
VPLLCPRRVPLSSTEAQRKYIQRSHFRLISRKGFFQSAMFLASALKRGSHPLKTYWKFNIPGGWTPLFRALAKNMAASYFGKKAPYGFVMKVTLLSISFPEPAILGKETKALG